MSAPKNRRWLVLCGLVLILAVAFGFWLWRRQPVVEPPQPDLNGMDPEVVEAITQARQEVFNKNTSGKAWGQLGMVLSAHGLSHEAGTCYAQAERLDPTEPRWPYYQAVGLLPTDPDAAIACLERAVERSRASVLISRLRLAEALLERGRIAEAERHYSVALTQEPNNLQARLGLGRVALFQEHWQRALDLIAPCRNDVHARKVAHTLCAHVYRRLGQSRKAEEEEKQAARLPPDEGWPDPYAYEVARLLRGLQAHLGEAEALTHAGQNQQAIAVLEEMSTRYPDSSRVWLGLGGLWFQQGRADRAEQSFRKAVQIDPNAAEGWQGLGFLQARDRPREAVESLRQVIRLRPDHAPAHFNLGRQLRDLGDRPGAAEEFRAALRCSPDYAEARAALKNLETTKANP
jgi:tetratricopeptide (TPR) repeat protein